MKFTAAGLGHDMLIVAEHAGWKFQRVLLFSQQDPQVLPVDTEDKQEQIMSLLVTVFLTKC